MVRGWVGEKAEWKTSGIIHSLIHSKYLISVYLRAATGLSIEDTWSLPCRGVKYLKRQKVAKTRGKHLEENIQNPETSHG